MDFDDLLFKTNILLKQNPETDYFMLINIKMRLDDLIKSAEIKLEQI